MAIESPCYLGDGCCGKLRDRKYRESCVDGSDKTQRWGCRMNKLGGRETHRSPWLLGERSVNESGDEWISSGYLPHDESIAGNTITEAC